MVATSQYVIAVVPPEQIGSALTSRFAFDEIEPHVTIKAQGGLNAADRDEWLPRITAALSRSKPVDIRLGPVGSFGDQVTYLGVEGAGLVELHTALMDAIKPSVQDSRRYFELEDWTPHLTVQQGAGADSVDTRELATALSDVSFQCKSLWLFRQDEPGSRYVRDCEISLG